MYRQIVHNGLIPKIILISDYKRLKTKTTSTTRVKERSRDASQQQKVRFLGNFSNKIGILFTRVLSPDNFDLRLQY